MEYNMDGARAYTLTLARRAAKDIREDNFRQLRGYVDMGAALSHGTGHKYFFSLAEKALSRADSLYYPLLQRMLDTMDSERLCEIMVNLGICTFTCGAIMLREAAAKTGVTPPWLLGFAAGAAPEDVRQREARVTQGEAEGTYVYAVLCADTQQVAEACALAQRHPKSTFALYAPARAFGSEARAAVEQAINTLPMLRLEGLALDPETTAMCDALCEARVLYGLVLPVAPEELDVLLSDTYLQMLAGHTMLCVCCNTQPENHAAAKRLQKGVYRTRAGHTVQLLMFDWDADVKKVNEYIAPHAGVSFAH